MPYIYSDPTREMDTWTLPDIQIFQATAEEVAAQDEDLIRAYMQRPAFRLAGMNDAIHARMMEAIVAEEGITGGWCYWTCLPGCLPDGPLHGPFETYEAARADARAVYGTDHDADADQGEED